MPDFIHLHNHSHYSMLDGAATVEALVDLCVQHEMDSFALTDHGNLYGTLDFYKAAQAKGVRPIIGCEVYVANGSRLRKERVPNQRNYFHLVLLAKNQTGYHNLLRLVSAGFVEGYYYRPRVDWELLQKYHEGLVAMTACLAGEVNQCLLAEDWTRARDTALRYRELFKDDFYLEIQNHRIPEEDIVRARMKELSDATAIPLVATNDIHYTTADSVYAHDMYICIRDQKQHDPQSMRYSTDQLYFKSKAEMYEAFAGYEDACRITREIADKCHVEIKFDQRQIPAFPIPETYAGDDLNKYFEHVCHEGLRGRYGDTPDENVLERLKYEIGVIEEMGFAGYFLIVQDFINYARQNDIRVGPGRGSAAGSIVAYALGITNIDPLKYDLLFERFLNPERVSMPDIDIDFEDRHRGAVIEYVRQKYGESNVAQIVTFGRLKAKAAVKDVGRVLGLDFNESNRITVNIPDRLPSGNKIKLETVRKEVPDLDTLLKSDPRYERVWENAVRLEGLNRNSGVHAAGVVITPGPLEEFVPLQRAGGMDGDITTQWDGSWIDEVGLLKMDFLGLRALTIIKDAQEHLARRDIEFDIEEIPLDDKATFELFGRGDTLGVFQFESSGMREYLRKLKPDRLDDLIAMNALYRPGPMDNIPSYIERRHGREEVSYLHPVLEKFLELTYGIIVYQEQVMQIAQAVGGFSLGGADQMRRAMGKKKVHIMNEMQVDYLAGAKERGIPRDVAMAIWELLFKFANYGFNKSHSAAYAWLAYQTAYLKANYTAEFLAAVMTDEMSDTQKMATFLEECRKYKICVLPPDVNASEQGFLVEGGNIRYGLCAIKNVGESAVACIVKARNEGGPFTDVFDFVTRVDTNRVNRKVLECLIQGGALDSLDTHRARLFANVEKLLRYAQVLHEDAQRNQASLFGESEDVQIPKPQLEEVPPWADMDRLGRERELIGIYVSGHPLDQYRDEVVAFASRDLVSIAELGNNAPIRVCGILSEFRTLISRRGKPMALGTIEDYQGSLRFMIFEEALRISRAELQPDALLTLKGKLSVKAEDDVIMIVEEVLPLEHAMARLGRRITISLDSTRLQRDTIPQLEHLLTDYPGDADVYFALTGRDGKPVHFHSGKYKVTPSPDFMGRLKSVLEGHSIVLSG